MKAIFVCNTLYQILIANIIANNLEDTEATIIISNHSVDTKKICDAINNEKYVFSNAFYMETKHLQLEKNKIIFYKKRKKIIKLIKNSMILGKYDYLYAANFEPFVNILFDVLYRNNKNLKIKWFEDGIGTYVNDRESFYYRKKNFKDFIKKILFKQYKYINWISEINLVDIDSFDNSGINQKLIKIDTKVLEDRNFILYLNRIFEYNSNKDDYRKKIIYFEDGYKPFDDMIDLDCLNIISKYISKSDIFIKIHPRNKNNKFENFVTNKNLGIPWEIIAINIEFSDTYLVTFFSSCVITPLILLKKNVRGVILAKLYRDGCKDKLFEFVYKNYLEKSDNFFIPNDYLELEEYIKKMNER